MTKYGHADSENEDNSLVPDTMEDLLLKFAVSDGATESSFSREWSAMLVNAYKDHSFERDEIVTTLNQAAVAWNVMAKAVELPWFAEQKLAEGAFAAFIGITIDREKHTYHSVAVGDCTLFHIRNNELYQAFPIDKSDHYNSTPLLVSSNYQFRSRIASQIRYFKGEIVADDSIILVTDALAAWFLREKEHGACPWNSLDCLLSFEDYTEDFKNWLNNQRNEQAIKNDDVTLIIINFK